ncbi:formate dehydrogenase accessory sulfurtransferase FdhD [Desulfovibrio oxyclinae]|uniref:formate dehydrogenase accessory sulfurtransferase FdhD n=1 Tax=Desulfovibrio oxyclinae TaxID=63560 RepID=UPI00035CB295|nr:formate dehydrogenase accessory sulfurtransferase FdhD [Desulfovibrio oxyclinae]
MAIPQLRPIEAEGRARVESSHGLAPAQVTCPATLQRYENGRFALRDASIAVEEDMRVVVDGREEALLSRTPGDDMNLVAGHLFARSRVREPGDILDVRFSYRGVARAEVALGGGTGIRRIFPSPRPVRINPQALFSFKERFEHRQNLYRNTGSTHAAALFAADGEMVSFGEDVGRHNAFDKAVGRALLEGTLERVTIAMLSSRLAFELAVKATTANIPILCGFSAATSSGISYADRNNLTLVGRLRRDSFNVYSNGWRIHADD